jgi:hypothetical protein
MENTKVLLDDLNFLFSPTINEFQNYSHFDETIWLCTPSEAFKTVLLDLHCIGDANYIEIEENYPDSKNFILLKSYIQK